MVPWSGRRVLFIRALEMQWRRAGVLELAGGGGKRRPAGVVFACEESESHAGRTAACRRVRPRELELVQVSDN